MTGNGRIAARWREKSLSVGLTVLQLAVPTVLYAGITECCLAKGGTALESYLVDLLEDVVSVVGVVAVVCFQAVDFSICEGLVMELHIVVDDHRVLDSTAGA